MGQLVINGRHTLDGSVKIHGAKNSVLPILAATVVTGKTCILHNCPNLTDIDSAVKILSALGCSVKRDGSTVTVDSSTLNNNYISDELMREMRSSIIFLGALISRMGAAVMTAPGGCDIGLRPVDLHLLAMQKLGVKVEEKHGKIHCTCKRVRGEKITLSFPSVGATENIILACVRANGTTTIVNAAREPEIVDLANFLNSCGAKIKGAGESTIIIDGVDNMLSTEYSIMPDRIVACTYLAAAAVTGSEICLKKTVPEHLMPVIPCFEQAGCIIKINGDTVRIKSPERLKNMETIRTMPYPGFPTDCQAIIMAMASVANGITVINENIFENRFKHVSEFNRMGANITVHDKIAVVSGVEKLQGAYVMSPDLRAGAAIVVAGLCADGETTVDSIHYIDRGYESIEKDLSLLGAKIKRID